MSSGERVRVYEQSPLLDVAGETIRPGGLALTERALAFCALPAGARVLDIGCGPGASVEHLIADQHRVAIGLDPSAVLLRSGRRRSVTLPLIQSTGEALPIADQQVDAVLTECSLSVMKDTDHALGEFWRVLRAGGYLILSDIYLRNPQSVAALRRLPIDSCLAGALPETEIIDRVQRQGFTLRLWEDHTGALKVFTAQIIWFHGSIQQFWCRATSRADATDIQAAIAESRPGYYLLIAQKNAH